MSHSFAVSAVAAALTSVRMRIEPSGPISTPVIDKPELEHGGVDGPANFRRRESPWTLGHGEILLGVASMPTHKPLRTDPGAIGVLHVVAL